MTASKRRKAGALAAIAAVGLLGLGGVAAGTLLSAARKGETAGDRIAPGVRVARVAVGGLTRAQATERLRGWAREALEEPVTLVGPRSGRRWNVALADAGGRFDIDAAVESAYGVGRDGNALVRLVARALAANRTAQIEPAFRLDEKRLKKRLARIGEQVRVPARNARARMRGRTLVVAAPERSGARLDVDATAAALLYKGEDALRDGGKATLVMVAEKPAVTAGDLGKVNHLLASFSTHYGSSSRDRRHNVALAAAHVDGTLIAPGGTFSYNDVVGPRSRKRGWRQAPTYQNGMVVPGTGGGICQVSSTLYNAALLGDMKIVRRSHHSMPVHYVRAGRDATVAYGAIDLQFRNPTDGPVYVAAHASGGRLTIALYGKEPAYKRQIRIVSGPRRARPAGGFAVTTYRVLTGPDGSTTRELVSSDTYRPLIRAATIRRPRG